MRYDDLAALSPVVRKEVISGELNRRIKSMDTVSPDALESVVDTIAALSLSDVLNAIQDPDKLAERVQQVTNSFGISKTSSPIKAPSPQPSQDSRAADALNATASAPDHPSTPISMPASLSTPPRTESPSGSVPPTSERERMAAAIAKLESAQVSELTELLMSLPKRERAMCLFNVEVLRAKLADAKIVLEVDENDETPPKKEAPATPQAKRTATTSTTSPQTPELSSRVASATASPAPATPGGAVGTTYTVASLARLPAVEIVRLASAATGDFPVARADPLVVQSTDEFIDSLLDKPIQMQKQSLGDKLCVWPISYVQSYTDVSV
jgi:polyadenylate-binding protein